MVTLSATELFSPSGLVTSQAHRFVPFAPFSFQLQNPNPRIFNFNGCSHRGFRAISNHSPREVLLKSSSETGEADTAQSGSTFTLKDICQGHVPEYVLRRQALRLGHFRIVACKLWKGVKCEILLVGT